MNTDQSMNKQVRRLYVVVYQNKVIHASTSLADFIRTVGQLYPTTKSLSYYEKKFKTENRFEHIDNLGTKYYLQKVK